ncbi:MAG: NADH-quinone oxidoreductase subunit C [Alphaproteobacteria bacterium]
MIPEITLQKIKQLLGVDLITYHEAYSETVLTVDHDSIVRVLTILRDHSECLFRQLIDITAVDYPEQPQRFEIVYHLLSHENNLRLRIKLRVDEKTPVPSIVDVFRAAPWYEREVWDLFGVVFADNPDLRRLLTDYDFEGHPLRKDFPLTGFVEVHYDDSAKKVVYDTLQLPQAFRNFDFVNKK